MARWNDAEISDRKVVDYLFAEDHPVGADKAAFFAAAGYTREDWTRLRDDLILVARTVS